MKTKFILDKIKEYKTIILHRHQNPDGDAYGSQFGLKYLIKDNWPEKKVFAVGEQLDDFSFLGVTDEVTIADYENALVIVTDTANKERIDGKYWEQAKYVIKIDHHPFYEKYREHNYDEWIENEDCAASLMIAKFALENQLKLSQKAAKTIYCGIVTDTGRFVHGNLKSETFAIVSQLYQTDFDWKDLYVRLYKKNRDDLFFQSYVFTNFVDCHNGFLYVKNKPEILEKCNFSKEKASNYVNLLSDIENVKIWAFFSQDNSDQTIKVSLRSRYYPIKTIAEKYYGGGHKFASGIIVDNWEQVDKIINDINQMLKDNGE